MTQNAPSYLTCRNGIYYAQYRVPTLIRERFHRIPKLIRKSTGTGNKREALKIARFWIEDLMAKLTYDELEDLYKTPEHDDDVYDQGLEIFKQYCRPLYLQDSILENRFLSDLDDNEKLALQVFTRKVSTRQREELIKQFGPLQLTPNSSISPLQQPISKLSTQKLGDLLDLYIDHKKLKAKKWVQKTENKVRAHIGLLAELLDDPYRHEITEELLRDQYAHRIGKIPKARQSSKYRDGSISKPIHEIIEIAKKTGDKTIGSTTIADHTSTVLTFLKWGEKKRYFIKDIHTIIEDHTKLDKGKGKVKDGFDKEDIKKMFENPLLQNGKIFQKPFRFWGLFLALYTGARLDEIAQIRTDEIKQQPQNQIWYIDITANNGKQLKTEQSARPIPIHNVLIELGFLKYCEYMKKVGEERLFPELECRKDTGNEFGRKLGRWFNTIYKFECGIDSPRKTFHSFRHTFINYGKQNGLNPVAFRELTGHETGEEDVHASAYEDPYALKILKDQIDQVNFEYDLSKVYRWEERFGF